MIQALPIWWLEIEMVTGAYFRSFQRRFPAQTEVFLTDSQGLTIAMAERTGDYLRLMRNGGNRLRSRQERPTSAR